ncbi:MAG TPA: glycosyltransferase family 9 protein [Candidatus Dormibacteraeota bacterium]|jgi:ADP-heptose:LPS heptosyltransferase|nr:glycosyltransferase family 9 protein [Candidatus Dormibacteraeota bacterium]
MSRIGPHVLVARLDNAGDVLLAGPAIRAVAAGAARVTLLCGPNGLAAARLLPGVDEICTLRAPWIDPEPAPVDPAQMRAFVDAVEALHVDQAILLTSFHQTALPLALLLRLARVPTIAAVSEDYPGSLLDVRHRVPEDVHEVERSLSLVASLGYTLPAGDDARLQVKRPATPHPATRAGRYVVVHPGASVPARAWSPDRCRELVEALLARGRRVVVSGGAEERELTAHVAGAPRAGVVDLGGATDLAGLAGVIAEADALVTGNTGPAHLAAAVGTPVVELYAPTVPAVRWRPWQVPHLLLGDQDIACRDCRARVCPVLGHPCVDDVPVGTVVDAVERLAPRHAALPLRLADVS